MGPVGAVTVNGLTAEDFSLTGGFGCQAANFGLGFFVNLVTDTIEAALSAQFDDLCRRCCGGDVAQCAP